jgi:hypothetical protein
MAKLWGREWSKEDLLRRVGRMSQVCGVRLGQLDDGVERGVRTADVWTGSGFGFTVALDRGMDIAAASWQGRSLEWRSSTGIVTPAFFEPEGLGWLRGFFGGLVVTCGLTYAGAPCEDEGQALGLHGRFSDSPASHVAVEEGWQGESYRVSVRGQIRETRVFGENVVLTRTISANLGENRFFLHDVVENEGFNRTEHMILYHINTGFPAVDDGAELVSPTLKATPRDAEAEKGKESYAQFHKPTKGYAEKVYYHDMATDKEGQVWAAVVNRKLGFGAYAKYSKAQLPRFIEWKMLGEGTYVVGMEPANCLVEGRDKDRARGILQFLEPGERREYALELGALTSAEEIAALDAWVKQAK